MVCGAAWWPHERLRDARPSSPTWSLAADVVSHTTLLEKSIRRALAAKLLDYMLPERYTFLDQFPLTPTGKVDRRALPRQTASLSRVCCVPPRNELEALLCSIWSEVLQHPQVGVEDRFYDLGGRIPLPGIAVLAARVL